MVKNEFIIKESSLTDLNITLTQALLLFAINFQAHQIDLDGLELDSFIGSNPNKEGVLKYFIFPKGFEAITKIIAEGHSKTKEVITDARVIKLQEALTELFPTGKKAGTNNYWRGNSTNVQFKLRVFLKKYGNFEDEKIISAVKSYIKTYERDTSLMRTLPYFIEKNGTSDLMTYIENYSETDSEDKTWLTRVV